MYQPCTTEVLKDIFWVGVNDWAIRLFHGYKTEEGSSYNSFLVMDEQPTLIDAVKYPFASEHIERIQSICPLDKIKFVIMNHAEGDHSSGLPLIAPLLANATIVTNAKCKESLLIMYPSLQRHENWLIVDAKSTLCIGRRTLTFIPVPMVHWPDSMWTYCSSDAVLFSNDGFGQHIACVERWADELPLYRVMHRLKEYNANILGHVPNLINKILTSAATMDIKYILTAHGVAWRGDALIQALTEYKRFASNTFLQKVTIVFDSMYCSTTKAAYAIQEGVKSVGVQCEVLDLKVNDLTKVALEMHDSAAFAFGSPTLNATMMPNVEGAISYCRGLKLLVNKPGIVFGAYGWAGRAPQDMAAALQRCSAIIENEKGIQWRFQVTQDVLNECFQSGQRIGQKILESQK